MGLWARLGPEVVQRMFLHTDRATRAALMCVCRSWNNLVEPMLLHSVNFDILIALTDDYFISHNHLVVQHTFLLPIAVDEASFR